MFFSICQMDKTSQESSNMELVKCGEGEINIYVRIWLSSRIVCIKENYCFEDLYHTPPKYPHSPNDEIICFGLHCYNFIKGCIFCQNFEIIPPLLESLPQFFDENFPIKLNMSPSLWFLFHFLLFSSLLWLFWPFAFSFSSLFQSYFTFSLL